ncbi:hypothetical protein BGZ75_007662 [Mortierella antarctica]|nr:hypothetical protein BGZ75_007662 [Mortierella antarctica]
MAFAAAAPAGRNVGARPYGPRSRSRPRGPSTNYGDSGYVAVETTPITITTTPTPTPPIRQVEVDGTTDSGRATSEVPGGGSSDSGGFGGRA